MAFDTKLSTGWVDKQKSSPYTTLAVPIKYFQIFIPPSFYLVTQILEFVQHGNMWTQ